MIADHPIIFAAVFIGCCVVLFLAWALCRMAALCDEQDGYHSINKQLWKPDEDHPTGIGA